MLLRTIVQKSLRGHVFLFLLGMYLGTALRVRMLTLFLTFWGMARLLSRFGASFSNPANTV